MAWRDVSNLFVGGGGSVYYTFPVDTSALEERELVVDVVDGTDQHRFVFGRHEPAETAVVEGPSAVYAASVVIGVESQDLEWAKIRLLGSYAVEIEADFENGWEPTYEVPIMELANDPQGEDTQALVAVLGWQLEKAIEDVKRYGFYRTEAGVDISVTPHVVEFSAWQSRQPIRRQEPPKYATGGYVGGGGYARQYHRRPKGPNA